MKGPNIIQQHLEAGNTQPCPVHRKTWITPPGIRYASRYLNSEVISLADASFPSTFTSSVGDGDDGATGVDEPEDEAADDEAPGTPNNAVSNANNSENRETGIGGNDLAHAIPALSRGALDRHQAPGLVAGR